MDETTFMYLTCDLPAPPLYPDEMRENIIPQVPLFGILNKFNGLVEKEYKTYKDSTLKRFEITQLPPFIILYIKVCRSPALRPGVVRRHAVAPLVVLRYIRASFMTLSFILLHC